MKIFAIGDLHFDPIGNKSMDKFGWKNHQEKIIENWKKEINETDIVLIPGDFSWAMKLSEVKLDLDIIEELPGIKIISRGNHDYWWESLSKMNKLGYKTIHFLQNNSYSFNGISLCGVRGWINRSYPYFTEEDEKYLNRETERMKISLNSIKNKEDFIIAMVHYPPYDNDGELNDYGKLLKEYEVDLCIYAHLHGPSHKFIKEGNVGGVEMICVASDYIDFVPKLLKESI